METLLVIAWFVSAVVGAIIGLPVGKPGKGAVLGFLFGPVGWVMMIFDIGALALTAIVAIIVAGTVTVIAIMASEERAREHREASAKLAAQGEAVANGEATVPSTKNPPPEKVSDDPELFDAEGNLRRLPPGTKVFEYWGYLRQHLSDGKLLVEAGAHNAEWGTWERVFQYCALSVPAGKGQSAVDGEQMRFRAIPAGTYKYTGVDGAARTIPLLLYVPAEAMPTASAKPKAPPSSVTWSAFPEGVDTPEERRAYLQQKVEAKRKREAAAASGGR